MEEVYEKGNPLGMRGFFRQYISPKKTLHYAHHYYVLSLLDRLKDRFIRNFDYLSPPSLSIVFEYAQNNSSHFFYK